MVTLSIVNSENDARSHGDDVGAEAWLVVRLVRQQRTPDRVRGNGAHGHDQIDGVALAVVTGAVARHLRDRSLSADQRPRTGGRGLAGARSCGRGVTAERPSSPTRSVSSTAMGRCQDPNRLNSTSDSTSAGIRESQSCRSRAIPLVIRAPRTAWQEAARSLVPEPRTSRSLRGG